MGGGQAPRANHLVHAAIKLIHCCSQHINIRVLLKKFKLPLKPLRLCDVVRIQARHKLRVDRGQASRRCGAGTHIAGEHHTPGTRICINKLLHNCPQLGAEWAVFHNDNILGRTGLRT